MKGFKKRGKKMRKKIIAIILAAAMLLSVCSCGGNVLEKTDDIVHTEADIIKESESSAEKEEQTETVQNDENTFSFAELQYLMFRFCSGAGGWATEMFIHADGSFAGEYFDGELGSSGEGYNATTYLCHFSGQFTQPVKVNDYTYSMQISRLNYEEEAGREEIIDGMRYCYTEVYGLEDSENILIYLPGAPLEELPQEFRGWVGYYDLSYTEDTELAFYALNNEAQQYGFTSFNIVENLKENIAYAEERTAIIENSIRNDPLTQLEYNEKTQELYEIWDSVLNTVWGILKLTRDAEAMNTLMEEEREWIAWKEQAVAEAGAGYEGGSMQPMLMSQKAAEMTKARVYELMEYLK